MKLKIVHGSDWHGDFESHAPLPEADVYVLSGDMLPNFPNLTMRHWTGGPYGGSQVTDYMPYDEALKLNEQGWRWHTRKIVPEIEFERQNKWLLDLERSHSGTFKRTLREWLLPDSCLDHPVVIVKGNHDFTNIGHFFARGWGNTYEITDDPSQSFNILGLKWGGCRGVNFMVGEWSDELEHSAWQEATQRLPTDLDVLVTHSPPEGILDEYYGEHIGSGHLARYVGLKNHGLKLNCFGHVHNQGGKVEETGGCLFSNAATTVNVFDLEVK